MPIDELPLELETAVTVLEDETRRAILAVLWRDAFESDGESGYTFEELRQAVGVEQSSRLSYHLQRMQAGGEPSAFGPVDGPEESPVLGSTRAPLVYREDDRYRVLRYVAQRIVQIWALSGPEHDPLEPTDVPWDCPHCDRGLVATHRHHRLDLWCPEHGGRWNASMLPGNAEGHSAADLVRLGAFEKGRDLRTLLAGFCQACWGPVEHAIQHVDIETLDRRPLEAVVDADADLPVRLDEHTFDAPDARIAEPLALHCDCSNCGFRWGPGLGLLTLHRPAPARFLAEQGVDVAVEPMRWRFVERSSVVRSLDPFRAAVTLAAVGERATFVVDERCRVVSEERSPAADAA